MTGEEGVTVNLGRYNGSPARMNDPRPQLGRNGSGRNMDKEPEIKKATVTAVVECGGRVP